MGLEFDASSKEIESIPWRLRHSMFLGRALKNFSRCEQEKDDSFFSPKCDKHILSIVNINSNIHHM